MKPTRARPSHRISCHADRNGAETCLGLANVVVARWHMPRPPSDGVASMGSSIRKLLRVLHERTKQLSAFRQRPSCRDESVENTTLDKCESLHSFRNLGKSLAILWWGFCGTVRALSSDSRPLQVLVLTLSKLDYFKPEYISASQWCEYTDRYIRLRPGESLQ